MRAANGSGVLALAAGLSLAAGCALIYDFSDYESVGTGGGATGTSSATGGSGGASVSSASSSSSGCADPNPGDCMRPVCTDGAVVEMIDDTDAPPDTQSGDCKRAFCKNGQISGQVDDTDVPSSPDGCAVGSCELGSPMLTSAEDLTPCDDGVKGYCVGGACAHCLTSADCAMTFPQAPWCCSGICIAGTCSDACKDGVETDIDCGGGQGCSPCGFGKACVVPADCASHVCTSSKCS